MLYARKIDLKNRNDSNVLLYEMAAAWTTLPPDGYQKHCVSELLPETAAFVLNNPQSVVFQYVFKAQPDTGRTQAENLEVLTRKKTRENIWRFYV